MNSEITIKEYYCPICSSTEKISTNHYGEIYPTCKICDCGTLYLKDKEHGMNFCKGRIIQIFPYKYNIEDKTQKAQYEAMCKNLKEEFKYKIFEVHSPMFGKSAFHEKAWRDVPINQVRILRPNTFKDQYISELGRIHDWFEWIFPNKNIKSGYYLKF